MFKSYLISTFRLLRGQSIFSILNIASLSLGLIGAFLISIWIIDEIRFDKFHKDHDRIYRVLRNVSFDGGDEIYTQNSAPWPLLDALMTFPEVESVAITTGSTEMVFKKGQTSVSEQGFYANSDFFDIFSWKLIQGKAV